MNKNNKMTGAVVMMTLMMVMGAQGLLEPLLGSSDPLVKVDLNLCLINSVGQFKTFCAEDYLTVADLKAYLNASFPDCFPNGIFIGNPLALNVHLNALDLVDVYLNLNGAASLLTSAPSSAIIERNVNYWGNDITSKDNATSIEECIVWANTVEGAKFVTYDRRSNQCWAKNSDAGRADDTGADSAKLASGVSGVSGGILAREILVLTINLALDAFNPSWCASSIPLAQLVVKTGPCAGLTVSQVLALANSIIAGGPCPDGLTLDLLVDVLVNINLNFRAALVNQLYLTIPKLIAVNVNLAC
jgi:hypothetical protein